MREERNFEMTRYVIHNHLPARRTNDTKPRYTKENLRSSEESVKRAEEAYNAAPMGMQKSTRRKELEKAKQHLERVKKDIAANGAKDTDDLKRYAGDVIWTDLSEGEYNRATVGSTIQVEGIPAVVVEKQVIKTQFSGIKHRAKVRFKGTGSDEGRDFRGVVGRNEEERNRDRLYRDTGITRVANDHWYRVGTVGDFEILEGAGVDGGSWMARPKKGLRGHHGGSSKFKSRREAERFADEESD